MLQGLTQKLSAVFEGLRGRGVLTEKDIDTAMRDIRVALLEADVALPVVRTFIQKTKERALGEDVIRSVTPGHMVVKIVHDVLVETLTPHQGTVAELNLAVRPPAVILMVGLQGAGKTTTTAKLAKHLTTKLRKRVLMASVDVQRPAAREQLRILGEHIGVDTFPLDQGTTPLDIATMALALAQQRHDDVLLIDTAGRLHIDDALMTELVALKEATQPIEVLMVADAMTGQDAVRSVAAFHEALGLTGSVLTRLDGDARGGAALSMTMVAGVPIKFLGVGEKVDQLQAFDPQRLADRILDRGDIVSLVEKAAQMVDQDEAQRLAKRMEAGIFDLEDLKNQLLQMQKMGGMGSLLGMLPGMGALKDKVKAQLGTAEAQDATLRRQVAIIHAMTPTERRRPDILNAGRKRRIAKGAGVDVQAVNRVLKQWKDMSTMMKQMKNMGKKGRFAKALLKKGPGGLF